MKADFIAKNLVWMEVNFYYNNVWLQRIQNVLRYFPHEIKATRGEDLLHGKWAV